MYIYKLNFISLVKLSVYVYVLLLDFKVYASTLAVESEQVPSLRTKVTGRYLFVLSPYMNGDDNSTWYILEIE